MSQCLYCSFYVDLLTIHKVFIVNGLRWARETGLLCDDDVMTATKLHWDLSVSGSANLQNFAYIAGSSAPGRCDRRILYFPVADFSQKYN